MSSIEGVEDPKTLQAEYAANVGTTRHVPMSKSRSGNAAIDMEILVMQRALHRLRNALAGDRAAGIDIEIVEHSMDRIASSVKGLNDGMNTILDRQQTQQSAVAAVTRRLSLGSDTDGSAPMGLPPKASRPSSSSPLRPTSATSAIAETAELSSSGMLIPTNEREQKARLPPTPIRERGLLPCADAAKASEAMEGVWGSVLSVAAAAEGAYSLNFSKAEVQKHEEVIVAQAQAIGLGPLAEALLLRRAPTIGVHGIPLPTNLGSCCVPTPAVFDNELLPPGIVRFAESHGIHVVATASSTWGKQPVTNVLDKNFYPFMTGNHDNSSVTVDFGSARIIPTAYGFASIHNILPGYFPRSWQVLASLDGQNWRMLKEHSNDQSFFGKLPARIWSLEDPADNAHRTQDIDETLDERTENVCRFLRILNTGPNSFGTLELQVSSFEVYGTILAVEPKETVQLSGTTTISRPTAFAPIGATPEPLPQKSKGKKK